VIRFEQNHPALLDAQEALGDLKIALDNILYTVPWQRGPVSARRNCEQLIQMMEHGMAMIRAHVSSYYPHPRPYAALSPGFIVPRRHDACVERWPECVSGEYDPRCCRFPKSCSCNVA